MAILPLLLLSGPPASAADPERQEMVDRESRGRETPMHASTCLIAGRDHEFCTAIIIGRNHLLTAAHCAELATTPDTRMEIYCGSATIRLRKPPAVNVWPQYEALRKKREQTRSKVAVQKKEIAIEESNSGSSSSPALELMRGVQTLLENKFEQALLHASGEDLAVIRVDGSLPEAPMPIATPEQVPRILERKDCLLLGWGKPTMSAGTLARSRLEIQWPRPDAFKVSPAAVPGDSGGGLFCRDPEDQDWYLLGINSARYSPFHEYDKKGTWSTLTSAAHHRGAILDSVATQDTEAEAMDPSYATRQRESRASAKGVGQHAAALMRLRELEASGRHGSISASELKRLIAHHEEQLRQNLAVQLMSAEPAL